MSAGAPGLRPNEAVALERAFALARAARGSTRPNPAVGAVVLDAKGKVVAEAVTSPSGRPHAERQALEKAGARARGGTVVVTLEPCVAFPGKKSPPCAAAVLLSGAERLVVGCEDPNPLVAGRGLHALRRAGLSVLVHDPRGEIADFYGGFGQFLTTGRTRVTLKVALSADGAVASAPGTRTAVTGPESRRFVHALRAGSDAVLVGASTALADDPELTVRDVPGVSPRRLVLWGASRPVPPLRLWDTRSVPTDVLGAVRPEGLPDGIPFASLPVASDGGADLGALLDWVSGQGCHDLLVEPGPKLLAAFLRSGRWDRLWVLRSGLSLPGGMPGDPEGLLPREGASRTLELGADRAELFENTVAGRTAST